MKTQGTVCLPRLRRRSQAVVSVILFLGLCPIIIGGTLPEPPRTEDIQKAFREDQILVQLRPGLTQQEAAKLHALTGGKIRRSFDSVAGLQVVAVPAGETVRSFVARYANNPQVIFAEPDYTRQTSLVPNDPKYLDGTLWGLNNFGQNGGTPGADIHAAAGWDILNAASNTIVAILDTGIRYTHEDLAGNMWVDPTTGSHGTNSIGGTSDPNDDSSSGHGTLMAGVIGAVGNNGVGVTGVAWHLQLMACKCFDSQGQSSDSAIIAALDYASAKGAHVASASFGGPAFGLALSNAIHSARNAGMIFVASAGNNSANIDVNPQYPACYDIDNIVSVAYFTRSNTLGILSNYGSTNVDLAAPGDGIYSTVNTSDSAYFPPPQLPINLAGTSYAAAFVSGALALVREKYPTETHTQIIDRLLRGTDPVAALAGKCATGGRLNLRKALSPPIYLTPLTPAPGEGFRLKVSTHPNRTCVVEAAANIGAWAPVYTNTTDAGGTFEFSDSASAGFSTRFYRAAAQP